MANCNDYISADDLKTGKQAILHVEHVAKSRDAAGNHALDVTDIIRGQSVTNKTLDGLEHLYETAISQVGYITLKSFQLGAPLPNNELTLPNQILQDETNGEYYRWDGTLPKLVPPGSTPASTGGVGVGAWLSVGDASLRSDIVIRNSIRDLLLSQPASGIAITVKGYVPGTNFGGGQFYWDANMPKSRHNGITIFSPTVPWDGSYAGLAAFLAGTGETDGSGSGCWMRIEDGEELKVSWGGFDISGNVATDSVVTAVIEYANTVKRSVRFDSGAVIKCGFTSLVQHYDKFNLNLQCSFVLDGISGIEIYAENDVEFNTDHPTYAERVVFRLKNCHDINIYGFNFNSDFTDYSISESDTHFKIQEHWKGFTMEGCDRVRVSNHWVNACHVFCMMDCTNLASNLQNKEVSITDNRFKYVVNYCFISRAIDRVIFDRNHVRYQGRRWHTFGEACAPTTNTRHISICYNTFLDQIAYQSCITPGPHIQSGLVHGNYCKRYYGIFMENGSTSNLIITNNISISTGERLGDGTPDGVHGTTHILLVGEVDDNPTGGSPHSNVLIQGNRFEGGGYAVQEYNTGTALRTGFQIKDNQMIDCIPPAITNQSFIGVEVTGNLIKAPSDFPDMSIAGQYPIIDNNILIGVRIKARDLGYVVFGPRVTNNTFRANSVGTVFPALIDYTDFTALVAEGNNSTAAAYTDFIVHPSNCNNVGFRRVGPTEGFSVSPSDRFGAKLTDAHVGDFVSNSSPTASGTYAWVCVNQTTKAFSSIALSA